MIGLSRSGIIVGVLLVSMLVVSWAETAYAIDVVHEGTARPGEWVAGLRVGPGFAVNPALSTVGPSLSFQGLYGLNRWLRIGMTLDYDNHGIKGADGSLTTITVLPVYLEYRLGRVGGIQPYIGSGIGVNINNKDVKNTFAWRTAGGFDYYLTNWFPNAPKGLALNTEVKYTRNSPDSVDGAYVALLFGARWSFGGGS